MSPDGSVMADPKPGTVPYTYTPMHTAGILLCMCLPTNQNVAFFVDRLVPVMKLARPHQPVCFIKGPYDMAKHLKSYRTPLQDDSFTEFCVWYNDIRTQMARAPYHLPLLPPLDCISPLVHLTWSPVDALVMPILPPPSTASITRAQQAY